VAVWRVLRKIGCYQHAWVSEGFFPRGPIVDFSRILLYNAFTPTRNALDLKMHCIYHGKCQ